MELVLGEAELREKLMSSNDEFRRLAKEHQSYARELEKLSTRPYLNVEERLQEINLKKRKLLLKDRMQSMVSQYRKRLEAES
jgi:uncharacterized protein YdcH (DUF465 family)